MKKLFNSLMNDDTSTCRVSPADLEYLTSWLSDPQAPVVMKQQIMALLKDIHPQVRKSDKNIYIGGGGDWNRVALNYGGGFTAD